MPRVIKLDSIGEERVTHPHSAKQIEGRLNIRFCPTCGESLVMEVPVIEYTCSGCRHLVDRGEKYCSFCGEELEWDNPTVEHYHKGKKISDEEFETRRKSL